MKSGSINLATVRYINGIVPLNGLFGVQLLCDNLSGNTTFNLQFSKDKVSWANAKEGGTEITGTLVDGTPAYEAFSGVPKTYYKILFAGATTGTVEYIVD